MTTNRIETGAAARQLGAELLARDRAALDASCEDARCTVCGSTEPAQALRCEYPTLCSWPEITRSYETETSEGGEC